MVEKWQGYLSRVNIGQINIKLNLLVIDIRDVLSSQVVFNGSFIKSDDMAADGFHP
jgi:hypothetical protein